MEAYLQPVIVFAHENRAWAPLIAFGESLAFISLLIPGWGALVAIGALIGPDGITFRFGSRARLELPAATGCPIQLGSNSNTGVARVWPLCRRPELIPRGGAFVKRWGILGIFVGRFFGPLRASAPLVAGIFKMPYRPFQTPNVASAFVWAAALLTLGDVIAIVTQRAWS